MVLTDRPLATRHACTLSRDPRAGLMHTEGTGKGPASGRCKYCRGTVRVERGLYGVFTWRGDGDYPHSRAKDTRTTSGAADKLADRLNDEQPNVWVVRWIPEYALLPDELDAAADAYWDNRPAGRDLRPVVTIETRLA